MQLSNDETRLVRLALRLMTRDGNDDIQRLSSCPNLLIHPTFVAVGQYHQLAHLQARLTSAARELQLSDRDIAIRALGRYAEALAESAEADDVGNDDFSSAERSSRERELKGTARLLARLTAGRPKHRRLAAVAVRSAI